MAVDNQSLLSGQLLAEILRLQRWAGGDAVAADRVFGLMHGFESVLEENRTAGISKATQDKVEDLLAEVDGGTQAVDGIAIKDWLRRAGVGESDAELVMQLCRLQGRFTDAIERITAAPDSTFGTLANWRSNESGWRGALHYVELIDSTDGARRKLHAAFSPCIPRVGDIVEPERGSRMEVVAVEHVAASEPHSHGGSGVFLTPCVLLRAIEE